MKRKRKRRKRIDYGVSAKGKLSDVETREQMRAKFPPELVSAFVKICEADWEDDELYEQYKVQEVAYLGEEKSSDAIESGKLVVQLSRATMDIVKKKPYIPKCDEHPSYRAIRKPRKDCKACWEMYNAKKKAKEQEEEAKETS